MGDVIGKGPQPLETLRAARHSVEMVGGELLIGNHEAGALRWLSERSANVAPHERHRVSPAAKAVALALRTEEIQWLRSRPYYLSLEELGVVVAHAGLAPRVPLAQQRNEHLITIRSIAADGSPSSRMGSASWAKQWRGPPHVVFGHDARRGLQRHPWATGIDSGCVYGVPELMEVQPMLSTSNSFSSSRYGPSIGQVATSPRSSCRTMGPHGPWCTCPPAGCGAHQVVAAAGMGQYPTRPIVEERAQ